ncbi:unnamed protein product [Dicrocoelium dendriticum]|nr:unnamed protein product [Dicrocoelium dendriticum]
MCWPIASSRGRGIFIISHPDEIPFDEPMVVSKYVSNPFLIDGFKFDVRIYVAVTAYDPLIVYIYEEGLVRFATVRYQTGTRHLDMQCMHLTNYSVNKKHFDFVQNHDENIEDFGNKWSLGALLRYLLSEGVDVTGLMLRIEDVIIKAFLSVVVPVTSVNHRSPSYQSRCFELYGFDIIVDENLRPWLLEVNLSPSLACDSPLDFKVKSHMLIDLLNLVGIVCHDPTRKTHGSTNSLHLKASGAVVVPPPPPAYFMSAEHYVNTAVTAESDAQDHSKAVKIHVNLSDKHVNPCSSVDILNGTVVSHLLPEGVTQEDVRLTRRLQEENSRAGGWLRLLPNPETWEQYASLWPQNNSCAHRSSESKVTGSVHNLNHSRIRASDYNHGLCPPISSAYIAAFAVHTLKTIMHNAVFERHEVSTSNDRVSTETKSQHSLDSIHPNSSFIPVNLQFYLRGINSENDASHENSTYFCNNHKPTLAAINSSKIPLHSLSQTHLRQHLCGVPDVVSDTLQSREPRNSVTECYANTLTRMPFFLRKLGEHPFELPGVLLSHVQSINLVYAQRPRVEKPFRSTSRTTTASLVMHREQTPTPQTLDCDLFSHSITGSASGSDSVSVVNPVPEITEGTLLNSENIAPTISVAQISAFQARQLFTAYLSRIRSRWMTESNELHNTGTPSIRMNVTQKHNQIDLLTRFLRKACNQLSSQAIEAVCHKEVGAESADSSNGTRYLIEVDIPDRCHHLAKRKRALVKALTQFIEIYQYETVMEATRRVPSTPVLSGTPVSTEIFWKFVCDANEQQLEELLSQYTKLHQSVDIFMGCGDTAGERAYKRNDTHAAGRLSSDEITLNHSPSTDSGLASSLEQVLTPDSPPEESCTVNTSPKHDCHSGSNASIPINVSIDKGKKFSLCCCASPRKSSLEKENHGGPTSSVVHYQNEALEKVSNVTNAALSRSSTSGSSCHEGSLVSHDSEKLSSTVSTKTTWQTDANQHFSSPEFMGKNKTHDKVDTSVPIKRAHKQVRKTRNRKRTSTRSACKKPVFTTRLQPSNSAKESRPPTMKHSRCSSHVSTSFSFNQVDTVPFNRGCGDMLTHGQCTGIPNSYLLQPESDHHMNSQTGATESKHRSHRCCCSPAVESVKGDKVAELGNGSMCSREPDVTCYSTQEHSLSKNSFPNRNCVLGWNGYRVPSAYSTAKPQLLRASSMRRIHPEA